MNVEINKPTIPGERPGRVYVKDGDISLIFQDGVYEGWYKPGKKKEKKAPKE